MIGFDLHDVKPTIRLVRTDFDGFTSVRLIVEIGARRHEGGGNLTPEITLFMDKGSIPIVEIEGNIASVDATPKEVAE